VPAFLDEVRLAKGGDRHLDRTIDRLEAELHRPDEHESRARRIVEERWLNVNDDGSGGMTLHDLAAEYKVSAERIRQIEVAAMKKMKKVLVAYA
jgi:DNA-directed RNA polymerase sigma subunit (sigma70/sigma32)